MRLNIENLINHLQKKDSGVAIVIGTILLIAISISLVSVYLFYYIPYQSTVNEENYYMQTETAFNTLNSKMIQQNIVPGSFATQPIPLGIPGEPPFTTSSDSSLIFSNSTHDSYFSLSLKVNLTVKTQSGDITIPSIYANYTSTGILFTAANNQYTNKFGYALANGLVYTYSGNQSQLISRLNFLFSNNSGNFSLYSTILNLSGKDSSVGGYGSTVFQSEYELASNKTLSIGENSTSYNSTFEPGKITKIVVTKFTFISQGTLSRAFDFGLINAYNSTATKNFSSWFIDGYLKVTLSNSGLEIENVKSLNMNNLDVRYLETDILAL
jgi:hypothetical protein